ncbi:Uncharacterised protein family (UPF0182) [Actinobaculum suis]|uniref:UPF0182 protein NCTC10327_00382 n=1 Tax=Actinobaculum suis TaxID=1657 RepID=A0A7Z8Y7R2_9ACTO|nr:UPF0182 family protein [Actinobaculum suis]VDG75696.1 Uncharacterised protein family (UPF0182) [Actinobaculum suis]
MTTYQTSTRTRRSGGLGAFIPTLVILALIVAALVVTANVYTEVQWYSQLGAVRVFFTQWGWALALGVIGVVLTMATVIVNLRATKPKQADSVSIPANVLRYRNLAEKHKWLTYLILPFAIALLFGAPLAGEWRTYLTWINRTPFGEVDPQFGREVSFYVFTLPVIQSILTFFTTLIIVAAAVAAIGHYLYGGISVEDGKFRTTNRARVHLTILGFLLILIFAAQLWISRYNLLLGENERFSGASYTDINAVLPGRTILAILLLIIAVLFVVSALRGMWRLVTTGVIVAVVSALAVGWAWPQLVQSFQVRPNAIEAESPYIQRNIDATLKAYGMDDIETKSYQARTEAESGLLAGDAEATAQIRLLDPNIVSPTFNQMQQNRQYYAFPQQLAVDRYQLPDEKEGVLRDTVIGVRALNLDGLDPNQRTWINEHTVYTHGFGVAAAYGNTTTTQGQPQFFQAGIAADGQASINKLGDYEPRVYFGQNLPEYSIVGAPEGTEPWEIDYPSDSAGGQQYNTYDGNGGPSVGGIWNKLMYAIKYRSTDIMFSDRVTDESQILFVRDPKERVQRVAPYLTLDSRVYPAVVDMDGNPDTPKRLVWMVDGYTTSNSYPYSARESLQEATVDALTGQVQQSAQVNYIRNSVKAVVDAYDGSVTLYQWDAEDPILNAWDRIFPGMLTPVSEMPGDLMAHVRYPEDLFKVQRQLLTRYHVTDPGSFYTTGDFWNIPTDPGATTTTQQGAFVTNQPEAGAGVAQPPYYLTLQMPGQDSAEFSLSTPFIPGGQTNRNIMTGFLAVDSNAGNEDGKIREGYGKMRLLELPRDLTVPGPGQAQNNFLADENVSRQLNLLNQGGTQVRLGNLLTLPVGGGMLYVQPVFVQASSGTSYPLMQYVLTAFGDSNRIGFAPTLQESLDQTFGGDSGAKAGDAALEDSKSDRVPPAARGDGKDAQDGATPAPKAEGPKKDKPAATPKPDEAAAPAPAADAPAQDRLNAALGDMQAAVTEAEEAMKNGDWAGYGAAQDKLQKALDQAVAADKELRP